MMKVKISDSDMNADWIKWRVDDRLPLDTEEEEPEAGGFAGAVRGRKAVVPRPPFADAIRGR